jgi:hypothetical protein
MGMYDEIRSSYNLGEQFTNVECQTKEIEDGIGGTLTRYWIDPSGYLWCGDYTGTSAMEIYEEGHPKYNVDRKWLNFELVPTGVRGKYRVYPITKYVEIYPATWDGHYDDWPRCRIHFKYGRVVEYETFPRNKRV